MLAFPFWLWVSLWVGQFRAFLLANSLRTFGLLLGGVILRYRSPVWQWALVMMVLGLNNGALPLAQSMVTSVMEYDTLCSGNKREGMFTALVNMIWKLCRMPCEVYPFVALAYLNYDPAKPSKNCGEEEYSLTRDFIPRDTPDNKGHCQTYEISVLLIVCTWWIPMVFETIELVLLLPFPMKQLSMTKKTLEGIAAHSKDLPARCPIYGHYILPPPLVIDAPADRSLLTTWVVANTKLLEAKLRADRRAAEEAAREDARPFQASRQSA